MRIALLGPQGMLGSDLVATVPRGVTLDTYTLEQLDVTDTAAVDAMLDAVRPDRVINATAYTAVDKAETERALADAVNGTAVGALGASCARRGIGVVHYSTDYVFDGAGTRPWREDDPTSPVNAYGASKLAGEQALLASGARALVLRTQWLYGRNGQSFPRTMWERATAGLQTRVVADQTGSPTSTVDLAAATWTLLVRDVTGVLHATNAGAATWHDFAVRVFARAGRPELLAPCTTADFPTPTRRPAYSVLDGTRLRAAGVTMRPWHAAFEEFLDALVAG